MQDRTANMSSKWSKKGGVPNKGGMWELGMSVFQGQGCQLSGVSGLRACAAVNTTRSSCLTHSKNFSATLLNKCIIKILIFKRHNNESSE